MGNEAKEGGGVQVASEGVSGGPSLVLQSCLFAGNEATASGGVLNVMDSSAVEILNCTFSDNSGGEDDGVVLAKESSSVAIANSIFWGNHTIPISFAAGVTGEVIYSLVEGGYPGEGNISGSPDFRAPEAGDYSLTRTSVCIDAANWYPPTCGDLLGNSWCDVQSVPNTGNGEISYIDMGALEFQTPECE